MARSDPAQRVARLRRARPTRTRDSDDRVPPGQFLTEKFPVLTYGPIPPVDLPTWRLRLWGDVENECEFTWDEFTALPTVRVETDIHCVTRWTKFDTVWEGVAFRELAARAGPTARANFVIQHAYGDYTTNLPLEELMDDDVVLAYRYGGEPLAAEHGGPMRLVVPKLYFWKSAKWLRGLEFRSQDRPGFWETYGYHTHGDPWSEERFS